MCVSARICVVESLLFCLSSEVFIRESVWCIFASVCVCNGLCGAQQDYAKMAGRIRVKCSRSMEARTGTK